MARPPGEIIREESMESFAGLNPILQAFLATLFTWSVTALGAAAVFLTRTIDQ